MHFFHQSGPVLKTHGTQKGRPSSISISETWAFHPIYFIQDEYALLKWRIYFIHVIGWLLHDAHVGMKLYLMEFRLSLLAKLLEHLLIHKHRKELDLSCHSRGFLCLNLLFAWTVTTFMIQGDYFSLLFPCFSSSRHPANLKSYTETYPRGKKDNLWVLCVCARACVLFDISGIPLICLYPLCYQICVFRSSRIDSRAAWRFATSLQFRYELL